MTRYIKTHTLADLEYDRVLALFDRFLLSDEGRQALRDLPFSRSAEQIQETQRMIGEISSISQRGGLHPDPFPSLNEIWKLLSLNAFSLSASHLETIRGYLSAAMSFILFLSYTDDADRGKDGNLVADIISEFSDDMKRLKRELDQAIESPGVVKMSHPRIAPLVRVLETKKRERGSFARSFLKEHEGSAQSLTPSFRDNRVVLPIRNDHKGEVEGLLHSTSAKGQTLYLEPYTLVSYNNSVVQANQEIEREIARIIRELSDLFISLHDEFVILTEQIGYADTLHARSRAMSKFSLSFPLISPSMECSVKGARHLLLGSEAIPISLEMNSPVRSLLLSGPNAGGKTVTIKTIGLLALMHQHLALVSAEEGSTLPLFSSVFTDIGDEQSIEKSLSTFSAHMSNIGMILEDIDESSLIVLDELGSGTDPEEGSAIGKSILEYCITQGGLTFVTSHHTALKQFAYTHEALINASMEFDTATHSPTFRIISGLPGDSHAIDTARRMSLPPEVIERAERYLGEESLKASEIIRRLEEKEREEERKLKEIGEKEAALREKVRVLDLQELSLKQREVLLRQEQIGSLSRFIDEKRSELENLVAELRRGEITREKTKKMKSFLDTLDEKKSEGRAKVERLKDSLSDKDEERTLAIGSRVLVGSTKREGEVTRIEKGSRVQVSVNGLKFVVDRSELLLLKPKEKQRPKVNKASVQYGQVDTRTALTLDVRGKTLSEAIEIIDAQIEKALMSGVLSFSIIHGLGTGVLMKGITDHLSRLPYVKDCSFARPEDGGHGKTYVSLNP